MKIISGGQTGADIGALMAAELLGLETGGWAAYGWETEEGEMKELLEGYGLKMCVKAGYAARTEMNVRDSDATVIISNERKLTGGSYMTECVCESLEKPVWRVWVRKDGSEENWLPSGSKLTFKAWVQVHGIRVLNIAGPRASKWSDGEEAAAGWLVEKIGEL